MTCPVLGEVLFTRADILSVGLLGVVWLGGRWGCGRHAGAGGKEGKVMEASEGSVGVFLRAWRCARFPTYLRVGCGWDRAFEFNCIGYCYWEISTVKEGGFFLFLGDGT